MLRASLTLSYLLLGQRALRKLDGLRCTFQCQHQLTSHFRTRCVLLETYDLRSKKERRNNMCVARWPPARRQLPCICP